MKPTFFMAFAQTQRKQEFSKGKKTRYFKGNYKNCSFVIHLFLRDFVAV